MTPASATVDDALYVLRKEIGWTERAISAGEHYAPWVLVTSDLSAYAARTGPGGKLRLEQTTSALAQAWRGDERQARMAALNWNRSLEPDQVEAAGVQPLHERAVLDHLLWVARAMVIRLQGRLH